MDTNNNIQKAKNVPPFVRYCSAIIPTMFDDSLSYYEALCALNNFLQTNVIDTINNNGQVTEEYIQKTEELQEYVDNYFDNLDVQDEINNKLDAMALDGTLANLLNVTALNQKLSILPEMFVNCTKVAQLEMPSYTGARVQSMAYDGTYWYVLFTTSGDNMVIRKYNGDFSNVEQQQQLVNGHGNSMCYFEGKLYIANYSYKKQINVYDATDLSFYKTITAPVDCRGFGVFVEPNNNNIVIAVEHYTSGQLRFYAYMPDGNLQYLNSMQSEYTNTYRNGCKFVVDSVNNTRFLFASVIGCGWNGEQLGRPKGNTLEFWIPATDRRFKVGLLGTGNEVQDFVHPTNNSTTYYIINNNGEVFTTSIELFQVSANLAFLGGSTQTSDTVCLYTGSKAKMETIGKYDSYVSGQQTYHVCNEFLLPKNYTTAVGAFAVNGTTRAVASSMKTNNTAVMGRIDVPLKKVHSYNGILYEIDGWIGYETSEASITNEFGYAQIVIKCKLGNNSDVRIKETTLADGSITYNRYQTYSALSTKVTTDGIGFVFGDVYPLYLRALGQIPNGAWELNAQPDLFDV